MAPCVAACSPEERVSPVSEPSEAPPLPDPPPPPQPVKRTVVERNPFGNVAERENLLWDGDFEWSSPFADQYGWLEPPSTPTVSDVVVGAECRSGVKCARLRRNRSLVGIGVGTQNGVLRASVWVRFAGETLSPELSCDDVTAILFSTGEVYEPDPDFGLLPSSEKPDPEGWCELRGLSPPRRNKVYLLVRNASLVPILVDDAVVVRADDSVQFSGAAGHRAELHPAAAEALAEAKRTVPELTRPRDDSPNAAREAFEAHQRKRKP